MLPFGLQAVLSSPADLAINVQKVARGAAVHLIHYDYDKVSDRVPLLPELELELRLPANFGNVEVYSPEGELTATLQTSGPIHRLTLKNLPLYSILLLCEG